MPTLNESTGTLSTGLFLLKLQSVSKLPGAPTLHLTLTVDTVNQKVSGYEEVTQALLHPVVSKGHVYGDLIYEYVWGPGSKVRIDLTGYPIIHWPAGGGVGPVILPNFRATLLLDTHYSKGEVHYEYLAADGWHSITQEIDNIEAARPPIIVLYGVTLHDAAASGDLPKLKSLKGEAEKQLADLQAGLASVNAAIAKAGG
jgi:hypothetical protein